MKKILKSTLRKREKRMLKRVKKNLLKAWVHSVKLRDNYTCQICGKFYGEFACSKLQAHHILAKNTYPNLIVDINNGVTLCFYDHKNSKLSPHLNALAFGEFFKKKFPDRYEYLISKLKEYNYF